MKTKTVTFKDKAGKAHQFKTPSGPIITAIILAQYGAGVSVAPVMEDGRQAFIVNKGLDAEKIAATHKAHYGARNLEIVKDWKEI